MIGPNGVGKLLTIIPRIKRYVIITSTMCLKGICYLWKEKPTLGCVSVTNDDIDTVWMRGITISVVSDNVHCKPAQVS
jgi:hypothetical protein